MFLGSSASRSEVGFPDQRVNVPVVLLAIDRYFFTGTRPTMYENLNASLSVAERKCQRLPV